MSHTILLAGGTGFIGTRLTELLRRDGHRLRLLSRTPRGPEQFHWDPLSGQIDDRALADADVVINMAGAGIADRRWTAARKQLLIDSRVGSARTLGAAFRRLGHMPDTYLAASAMGYYGPSGERWMHEDDRPAGYNFLVQCCTEWEQATSEIAALGIRTVIFRTGLVLSRAGGALAEIAKPLHLGIGAYFADGQAWYSWIHRDDLCRAYIWAMDHAEAAGVFNAVAPQPVRNIEFVKAAARAMKRRVILAPVPAFAMRMLLGEMALMLLSSHRISAQKITRAGFGFQYPDLATAMAAIFQK